jgi:dTDP-4-amino-4,6-dideoxygalactose transaminase
MAWRALPPVYSPLDASCLAAAALAGAADPALCAGALAEKLDARTPLLTDCGTSALALAIRAAATAAPDRPVALPAYACFDLVSAALAADVPVTFYDVDPQTLAPEPASVADALRAGVSSLVIVHQYGLRVELEPWLAAAAAAGVPLIEDAAQAWGGRWRGKPLGTHGAFGVFSFGRGKGLTGGGGGALLVGEAWRDVVAPLAAAAGGRARAAVFVAAQWLLARPALYRIPLAMPGLQLGETHFREPHPPRAIAASSAAVLRRTLPLQTAELRLRRAVAASYAEGLRGLSGYVVPAIPGDAAESAWLRFPVLAGAGRDRLAVRLRHLGVARGYPLALPRLPQVQSVLQHPRPTPGAETLAGELLTLPTHSHASAHDRRTLLASLANPAFTSPD